MAIRLHRAPATQSHQNCSTLQSRIPHIMEYEPAAAPAPGFNITMAQEVAQRSNDQTRHMHTLPFGLAHHSDHCLDCGSDGSAGAQAEATWLFDHAALCAQRTS